MTPSNKARREASRNKFVERVRYLTELKNLGKLIVAVMVREPGLDLSNPFEINEKDEEFD